MRGLFVAMLAFLIACSNMGPGPTATNDHRSAIEEQHAIEQAILEATIENPLDTLKAILTEDCPDDPPDLIDTSFREWIKSVTSKIGAKSAVLLSELLAPAPSPTNTVLSAIEPGLKKVAESGLEEANETLLNALEHKGKKCKSKTARDLKNAIPTQVQGILQVITPLFPAPR